MADRPTPEARDVIKYHRRLDRTPEKNFHKLPDADKILISQIRQARESNVSAVRRLKDDIEEREKVIEEERSLRLKAEERLKSHLVDMYNNSDVNSELRDRLPKASKKDILMTEMDMTQDRETQPPLAKSQKVTDEMVDALADQFARLDNEDNREYCASSNFPADENIRRNSSHNLEFKGPFIPHERVSDIRRHSFSDASDLETQRHSVGARQHIPKPSHQPYNHMLYSNTSVLPPPIYSSHFPLPSSVYGAPTGPQLSNLPFQRNISMSTPVLYPRQDQRISDTYPTAIHPSAAPHSVHLTNPCVFSVPVGKSGTQEKTTLSSSNESGFSSTEESGQTQSLGISPPGNAHQTSHTSDLGTSKVGSLYAGVRGGQIGAGELYPRSSVVPSGVTYSSYIQRLLSQLEAQRDIIDKLKERLTLSECNAETVQINNQQKESEARLEITEKVADLVKEIYTAQKSCEEYILEQVKAASQNGGEMMQDTLYLDASEYDRSEAFFDHSVDSDDSDLENKVNTVTRVSSPNSAAVCTDATCDHLLKQIERLIQAKEIMQKQMQALIMDRDKNVSKWWSYEKDLRYLRENLEKKKRELLYMQHERDVALKKAQQLEEGVHNAQLAYSLQKSLSPEAIHNTLTLQHPRSPWTDPPDKNQLNARLRRLMSERDELQENNKRLERQVKVLQRKLTESYASRAGQE